jgi:outer membrane biosynthesis protein TonB
MKKRMRTGMMISLALHAAVLTLVVTGLPDWLDHSVETPQIIPVDVVQIDEKTQVRQPKPPEVKPEPKPEPPKPRAEPPKPEPKPDAVPPPPDEIANLPKPRKKVERPKPEPEPKLAQLNIKPRAKPKPPKPRSTFNVNDIQKLIDRSKKDEAPSAPQPQSLDVARQTASLQDAIRSQVQSCWLVPAGAPEAENLVVRLKISLNPDGSLSRPPEIVDQGKIGQSDYYRVAAESARRAVQKCSPLKLPVDSYDLWRDIELTFDPKQMITG